MHFFVKFAISVLFEFCFDNFLELLQMVRVHQFALLARIQFALIN